MTIDVCTRILWCFKENGNMKKRKKSLIHNIYICNEYICEIYVSLKSKCECKIKCNNNNNTLYVYMYAYI